MFINKFFLTTIISRFIKLLSLLVLIVGIHTTLAAQKINGMSFSGPKEAPLVVDMFEDIKTSNANWVALVPEATLDRSTLQLVSDEENDWWGGTLEANIQGIELAKQAGLKVFLKPHIVLGKLAEQSAKPKAMYINNAIANSQAIKDKTRGAEWRGTLSLKKEMDWRILETSYEAYILQLATIAASLEVDLFAVGTELKQFAIKRPAFWKQLIRKVRNIYSGPLTYAANWDEYNKISFWQELDYIGVDTYFPINRMETPEIKKTIKNWRSIQKQIRKLSKAEDRPILLTEFGYRNVSYAGKRPWTHDKGKHTPNYQAQVNLYEAFFQTFWKKSWVAGGFSWKWFAHPKAGENTSFSVQGKPALSVLQKWYEKNEKNDE